MTIVQSSPAEDIARRLKQLGRPDALVEMESVGWEEVRRYWGGAGPFVSQMLDRGLFHWGVIVDGQLASVHAQSWWKKERNGDRYANTIYLHTKSEFRGVGMAEALFRLVKMDAVTQGCTRLKSLIDTVGGVAVQMALGHAMWGTNERGHLVVDQSLDSGVTLDRIPSRDVYARVVGEPRLLGEGELLSILTERGGVFEMGVMDATAMIDRFRGRS